MRGKALSPWWSPPQEQTDRVRERSVILCLTDISQLTSLHSAPSQKAEQRRCWCCAFCRALSVSAAQLPSLSLRSPVPPLPKNTAHNHTTTHAERLFAVIMSLVVQFTGETREVWPWSEALHLAMLFGGIMLPFTQVQIYVRYHMDDKEIQ